MRVWLDELREVHVGAEVFLDRAEVAFESVRREQRPMLVGDPPFNHANFGAYVTDEASTAFGQPVQNLNAAHQPRQLQTGFRFAF